MSVKYTSREGNLASHIPSKEDALSENGYESENMALRNLMRLTHIQQIYYIARDTKGREKQRYMTSYIDSQACTNMELSGQSIKATKYVGHIYS